MAAVRNTDQAFTLDAGRRGELPSATRTSPSELAPRWANIVALVAAGGIVAHLLLRFAWGSSAVVSEIPLYVALVLGGARFCCEPFEKTVGRSIRCRFPGGHYVRSRGRRGS
jgi:hypothetical protein